MAHPMHADDAAIIERYLRGERDAVALVERWLSLAASPFRRRLGIEWEEAVQDARLEAYRELSAGRFRGEARLKTYLGRMACLTCIDALRRLRRRPRLETDEESAEVASSEPSPLDIALQLDARRSLNALFASTSPECRKLWTMIHLGLSYKEMATRVGVAEGTLRVRVHRCRRRALELLDGNAAPSPGDDDRVESDGLP
jgi:RNA polymerase sigma-70 factor (ECF subfamily)